MQANKNVLQSVYDHYARLMTGQDASLMDMPEWMELLNETKSVCSLSLRSKAFSDLSALPY